MLRGLSRFQRHTQNHAAWAQPSPTSHDVLSAARRRQTGNDAALESHLRVLFRQYGYHRQRRHPGAAPMA